VAALVFGMIVVGGITRLTESGLSIVEWAPVSGTLPPIGEAAWQAEFDAYKATPQYIQVNTGMSLAEFKNIYFWEYVHRLLGRVIGLVFALPFAWFAIRRAIPAGYGWRLTALLVLGGLQGFIGWWMVASASSTSRRSATSGSPCTFERAADPGGAGVDRAGSSAPRSGCVGAGQRGCRRWPCGRSPCWRCRCCSAPMSRGWRPATRSTAGR
jgi:hypothetical protein